MIQGLRAPSALDLPSDGEVHVWTAVLGDLTDQLEELGRSLPTAEREAAQRIRAPQRRREYLAGRVALRSLLRRYLGSAAGGTPFRYLGGGKPVLADPCPALHFSVAHSGGVLAVAFAASGPVGVDLERMRPVPQLASIARVYFTEGERRWLSSLGEHEQIDGFFRLWTCREAAVKVSGQGISGGWRDLEVLIGPGGPAGVHAGQPGRPAWHLVQPRMAPGLVVSVVGFPLSTTRILQWNLDFASS